MWQHLPFPFSEMSSHLLGGFPWNVVLKVLQQRMASALAPPVPATIKCECEDERGLNIMAAEQQHGNIVVHSMFAFNINHNVPNCNLADLLAVLQPGITWFVFIYVLMM